MKKVELLAPAGDLEKLKMAIIYGADAVYFGGEMFSLRAGAGNLSIDEIKEALSFCHERGKKCYETINIYAHNEDIEPLKKYLNDIKDLGIDGFIVSDYGIVNLVKEIIPNAQIHLSTQANMTNYQTAMFWYNYGIRRIVLARELTFDEIKEIISKTPDDLEFESFIHGAMCISYSGRCLLSNFMAERDSNRGMCAHPCRWKYALMEEKREGEYFPIEEDNRGTYILNSRDMCMIEYIPQLIESGILSLKIEGRMKSSFYVSQIVSAYRKAIDSYYEDPINYKFNPNWLVELKKASHREFTTGFYFNKPTNKDQNYQTSSYTREYTFTGLIKSNSDENGYAFVEQRNKMEIGDKIEVFGPDIDFFTQELTEMYDSDENSIESCPHPQQLLKIKFNHPVKENYMIRIMKSPNGEQ